MSGDVDDSRGWAATHKKMAAALATATAIVGLTTGVLTLRDQLFSDDEPAKGKGASRDPSLTSATASKLLADVHLGRFERLLGPATAKKRLHNDEWLVSTWESPDIAVSAFSNRDSQVVAYMLASLGPGYTPLVEYVRGGIRLRQSVFADILDEPTAVAGVFPPNGQYSYEELYLGGSATQHKSVVLAASFAANADDRAATELTRLDCLPFSIFERNRGCASDRLTRLREGLHVTSMTVGAASALEALAQDGALFFPGADMRSG